MTSRAWIFAFFAAIALPAACTFPDVTFTTGSTSSSSSGSTGGATSGNPTSGGNSSTQNTGGAGQGGLGGATSAGGATSGGGSVGGGGPCPGKPDPCDCDGDHHRRPGCGGTGGGPPDDDCNDNDNRVFPGQTMFFTTHVNGSDPTDFDFDCDGSNAYEYTDVINCMLGLSCNASSGWIGMAPDCGISGPYETCKNLCSTTPQGSRKQGCH